MHFCFELIAERWSHGKSSRVRAKKKEFQNPTHTVKTTNHSQVRTSLIFMDVYFRPRPTSPSSLVGRGQICQKCSMHIFLNICFHFHLISRQRMVSLHLRPQQPPTTEKTVIAHRWKMTATICEYNWPRFAPSILCCCCAALLAGATVIWFSFFGCFMWFFFWNHHPIFDVLEESALFGCFSSFLGETSAGTCECVHVGCLCRKEAGCDAWSHFLMSLRQVPGISRRILSLMFLGVFMEQLYNKQIGKSHDRLDFPLSFAANT